MLSATEFRSRDPIGNWSLERLSKAFHDVTTRLLPPVKLCLFIDGLDEFEGDCYGMAELLKNIASAANIKVCVSSRPWLVLEEAFQHEASLRLQDLTRPDIETYVTGNLSRNNKWQRLAEQSPLQSADLITIVLERANGVFLWVKLVVASLLKGINNCDDISDLQKRLDLLPVGLENLYRHMLGSIEPPFYKTQASEFFQLVRADREIRDEMNAGNFHTPRPLSLLDLAFADIQNSYLTPFLGSSKKTLTPGDIAHCVTRIKNRLNTRCLGLLEIGDQEGAITAFSHVTYLHRTVRDFLEKEKEWTELLGYTKETSFQPSVGLLASHTIVLRDLLYPSRLKVMRPLLETSQQTMRSSFAKGIKLGSKAPLSRRSESAISASLYLSNGDMPGLLRMAKLHELRTNRDNVQVDLALLENLYEVQDEL
jgi:hypothetical protein